MADAPQCDFGECANQAEAKVRITNESGTWVRPICGKCLALAKLMYSECTGFALEEIECPSESRTKT